MVAVVDTESIGSETATWPVVAFDRDDIFGVRRAWALLSEDRLDTFLAQWVSITETCGYDIPAIEALAAFEAQHWQGIDSSVSQAWWTISAAMGAYLAWREG